MNTFNAILSSIFDVVFGWFGAASAWIDILFWSILGGIVALLVYKLVSNQAGIERAKNGIKVHLLEIRLFPDDVLGVVTSTAKILGKNALYIGHNIVPMLVMFVPMMAILFQLEAHYAFAPIEPGQGTYYLTVAIDRDAAPDLNTADVRLEAPDGITVAARVPTPDEVVFQLRDPSAGDHVLKLHLGAGDNAEVVEKRMAVGGELRKVPYMLTKGWEGYLYPGEGGLPSESAAYSVSLEASNGGPAYPDRDLGHMPGGEGGVLLTFFLVSIGAGLALKGVFGVTL
ncbi:MAG: hypothetical protein DRQ55_10795 [Planctomycetota bacterium]|nr:MAG: hypothetical protein DRQ55_10795 [Planctomycetota bacterium]